MGDLNLLLKQFENELSFTEDNKGFLMLHVNNQLAAADISLYAGQVMSYKPHNQSSDLLFQSDNIAYIQGRALRGGVPICWPWFGNDYSYYGRPPHGFARNQNWQLIDATSEQDGKTVVVLELRHTENTLAVWPKRFILRLIITVGDTLTLALQTKNLDEKKMTISQAFHTYFKVSHIDNVEIFNLEDKPYLDKLEDFAHKMSDDSVTVSEEIDRIYQQVDLPVELLDIGLKRKITITSTGSKTTVVWNPWRSKTKNIEDLSEHSYQQFVCIETANAADDLVVIQPDETHTISTTFDVTNLT